MARDDRLSALPDHLLRRVLHFAPAKEAASTRALSRRWRSPPLRSSGAVNLERHVDVEALLPSETSGDQRKSLEALFFSRRDAFVSAAQAMLAADEHVTRLTLSVPFKFRRLLTCDSDKSSGVIATILSHPAARRVEELRLAVEDSLSRSDTYYDYEPQKEIAKKAVGEYTLSLIFLPSNSLRVLELTDCSNILPPAATVVFTRLLSMRLRHCTVRLDALQSLFDAVPALATIRLESVVITIVPTDDVSPPSHHAPGDTSPPPPTPTEVVLRCPAAIVLVLQRCSWRRNDHNETSVVVVAVEIHAPRLRHFVYMGLVRRFTMSPRPQDLARADLHFFWPCDKQRNMYPRGKRRSNEDPDRNLVTFWRFLQDLRSAKELNLRVNNLEDMAVRSEARRVELLPAFSNLERLELQGVHRPKGKTASVAIANLLRCSPVLCNLRINLTTAQHGAILSYNRIKDYVETKFLADRDKSIDLINRAEPTTVSLEDDGDVNSAEVLDIPGLSRHSFECLRSSLKKVGLQFRLEESNCLGVKLIKFFTENAMVLEEMHIDSGNGKLCEHMNSKVKTWITKSSKRRKPGASSFMVLPLESRQLCNERRF